jgi:leucine-rich repeat protein SHOC2
MAVSRRLKRLKMLDLRENKISELPTIIADLQCLSILLLSSNQLKAVPEEIGQCSQLTQLDLQHNELERLPDSIGYFYLIFKDNFYFSRLIAFAKTNGHSL